MENISTILNGDDSKTSNGDSEAEHFWNFLYARGVHALNLCRINYELQAERLPLIEGYRVLVGLDSSLIPLDSSCFQEDDEIMGITMVMIQNYVSSQNDQSAQGIRKLENLQNHLLNLRIERSRYYVNSIKHRHNQKEEQENEPIHVQRNENWKRMVEMECYHVIAESEILQKLNKESPVTR